jgi:hypothetical protein
LTIPSSQIHGDKVNRWLPRLGQGGTGWCLMVTVSALQDKKILEMGDDGGACILV